jgi:carbonic anhydrase
MNNKISIAVALLISMSGTAFASGKAHWSYEGHEGPAHWGELNHDYHMCKDGKQQSPINLTAAHKTDLGKISFTYKATAKEILNNGHTIQINMNEGSSISVNGKTYNLLQFHFHSPSEHQVNGVHADMVAHFVHQAADGQLGVIGVLFNKGKANATLAKLWSKLPKQHDEKQSLAGVKVDVSKLLPVNKAYYNYSGSLTTPPCSEGVNWMVLQAQSSVSAEQVNAFTSIFAKSIRPVQGLNGRDIKASK